MNKKFMKLLSSVDAVAHTELVAPDNGMTSMGESCAVQRVSESSFMFGLQLNSRANSPTGAWSTCIVNPADYTTS